LVCGGFIKSDGTRCGADDPSDPGEFQKMFAEYYLLKSQPVFAKHQVHSWRNPYSDF
jgi:hypothetical protein